MNKLITYTLLLVTLGTAPCWGQDTARRFIAGVEAYKASDYDAAITAFEHIAQSGVRNGQLFYNLGNAYLKNNNLGRAILWYERALQLLPNDPDLKFNLTYARSLTQDAVEPEAVELVRIFFFWRYQLSARTILILAITGNFLIWSLAIGWRLTGRRALRRATLILLLPTAVFVLTGAYNYYEAAYRRQGIVLTAKVPVRAGLEDTDTELFVLHAGAKIRIIKKLKAHFKIQFAKDKIGWVDQSEIGLI